MSAHFWAHRPADFGNVLLESREISATNAPDATQDALPGHETTIRDVAEASNRGRVLGGAIIGRTKHSLADAHALLFQSIQQTPRPDELRCKYAQREHDGQNARPGGDDHQHTNQQERKSDEDLEEAPGLLKCLNDHSTSRFLRLASRLNRLRSFRCSCREQASQIL